MGQTRVVQRRWVEQRGGPSSRLKTLPLAGALVNLQGRGLNQSVISGILAIVRQLDPAWLLFA
jgi:hypothetical protein